MPMYASALRNKALATREESAAPSPADSSQYAHQSVASSTRLRTTAQPMVNRGGLGKGTTTAQVAVSIWYWQPNVPALYMHSS